MPDISGAEQARFHESPWQSANCLLRKQPPDTAVAQPLRSATGPQRSRRNDGQSAKMSAVRIRNSEVLDRGFCSARRCQSSPGSLSKLLLSLSKLLVAPPATGGSGSRWAAKGWSTYRFWPRLILANRASGFLLFPHFVLACRNSASIVHVEDGSRPPPDRPRRALPDRVFSPMKTQLDGVVTRNSRTGAATSRRCEGRSTELVRVPYGE